EQLPLVDLVIADELVPICADSVMRFYPVWIPELVIVIVDRGSPILRLVPGQQWNQASALHPGRNLNAQKVENRRRVIDVHRELIPYNSCLDVSRGPDHQRDTQRLLVHEAFIKPTVVTQKEAVVAGVNDDCIVRETTLLQELKQPADVVILRAQCAQKVGHELLVVPLLSLALGEIFWRREVRHIRNSHTRGRCRTRTMRVIVPESSGFWNSFRIVKMLVLMRRIEGPVRVEVLNHHQERLRELFHSLDRKIGRDVGLVSFMPLFFDNIAAQLRIAKITFGFVVRATGSLFEDEVVETHVPRICGKVPFAHNAGLIAVLLQKFRNSRLTLVEGGLRLAANDLNARVGYRAINVAIGACE